MPSHPDLALSCWLREEDPDWRDDEDNIVYENHRNLIFHEDWPLGEGWNTFRVWVRDPREGRPPLPLSLRPPLVHEIRDEDGRLGGLSAIIRTAQRLSWLERKRQTLNRMDASPRSEDPAPDSRKMISSNVRTDPSSQEKSHAQQ